ncbi:LAGLIDADG family homing endonuclease [Halolamina salifodinae]|uniref:DNA helicase n=1 Tax=Halolamina salifodinae TaxID=1202767 RepID=A0A8T4GY57_9EURY|nr:LAGLIDADG family homing endonuclease [Halolamina salifodinae]MBP1987971.1 DNA replicative helicase MCM subunit Mcm2 (Cdc46/Mcm family) [Halolamina salifodinae]
MAQTGNQELTDRFIQFYRNYYRDEVGRLAQEYPNERRSLYVDYNDLFTFDRDLAEDYLAKPEQMQEYAEEALRLYDLPADVSLGQAHVRLRNLPSEQTVDIRDLRVQDDHIGSLVAVQGIIRKATDVRPKVTEAAFECQRCGTMSYIPQTDGGFQEPHECQGCERQGPFSVNHDQSEFVDSQKLRVQESPEGLRGGETPQSIDVDIEDDVTGNVTAGDHVTVTGVLHIEQVTQGQEKTALFDLYMDGVTVEMEDEEFEAMDIDDEDIAEIVELSNDPEIYEKMVGSIAPAIYGYDQEKLAMVLQLFSGVTKHLPDGSRIRGDLHLLLIGDPGTGKCLDGDTRVTLADGHERPIRELVEENLDDPKPVDDGVWDEVDFEVPSMQNDGHIEPQRATKVWKREAPEKLYRIRTASGRELDVTPSHPLFVPGSVGPNAVRAAKLEAGQFVATAQEYQPVLADGGTTAVGTQSTAPSAEKNIDWDRIESIEAVEPEDDWVYDLEVEGTHNYISNGVVSHNSQMISYVEQVAPRSVYTSGKGSSAAGLTAAAVRDDFGDGQQWTLEAGALVLADKGIAAVDELDKMDCVTGDTLVSLSDGRVERIDELAREAAEDGEIESLSNGQLVRDVDLDVWTMDEDGQFVERPVSVVHEYDAPSELTRVEMATGEELTATADHPFFVLQNGERIEREAARLDEGDWVYVPREVPTKAANGAGVAAEPGVTDSVSVDDGVSPAMASVLGYLSGDGNVYYDREEGSYGVRFVNADGELLDDFERAAEQAFGTTPTRPPSEQRGGVGTVRVNGKEHADAVLEAGMSLGRYDEKCFPAAVSTGSRAAKAAFVRALADSEGHVDVASGNVRVASASRDLLRGTRSLLLQFGVSSQLQRDERDDGRDVYYLTVTDADSLAAFRRFVGFTATRKAEALEEVVDSADGDRTILDVIPEIDGLLSDARDSLRLHQSECGINPVTYCDFENGTANVSLHRARRVLDAFESRRESAAEDRSLLDDPDWETLGELKARYHASQSELADGTALSQQQISREWGEGDAVRQVVAERLQEIVAGVSETDLDDLRQFVNGDVKWRRVESVETVDPESAEHRGRVLRERLTDVLGGPTETAEERARELLAREPTVESLDELAREIDAHGVSHDGLARGLGVAQSTVSRWLSGTVETDRFDDAREAALAEIGAVRRELRALLDRIEDGETPKVYDLTVEGTHNFVANGLVVHNSSDRSAMHEGLEQQKISVSKAGINATLKSRCSLLGAANPKYGRFDQYEPIGEQIDLEPALISRFDLIFTVTDEPDPEHDSRLAEHILKTNYAGELNTQREEVPNSEFTEQEVDDVTEDVAPDIDAELLRKYIAYAKRNVYPTMTDEAKDAIEEFYVDLRAKGADEDAPVPVTARKLEALVRLAEASARVRLSDTVDEQDADKVIKIVRDSLEDIGVDPETGEFDADVVETGTTKSQRDRIKSVKALIGDIEEEYDEGAPIEEVLDRAGEVGMDEDKAEKEIESLRKKGELYEPVQGHLRTT